MSSFKWCAPGGSLASRFILKFEDAEVGDMYFDEYDEAVAQWDRYCGDSGNWNGYLFGVVARQEHIISPYDMDRLVWRLPEAVREHSFFKELVASHEEMRKRLLNTYAKYDELLAKSQAALASKQDRSDV